MNTTNNETQAASPPVQKRHSSRRVKTRVKAGALTSNHGLRVKTRVKAGALTSNHGLRVKTRAG